MAYEYEDPIIHQPRAGTSEDPLKEIEEPLIIDNSGKVQLTEYPDRFYRVIVTGENQSWFETEDSVPNESSYRVDYERKTIHFNINNIGKQLSFRYLGRGNGFIPVNSIYVERNGLTIVETLDGLITSAQDARDNANQAATNANNAAQTALDAADTVQEVFDAAETLVNDTSYKEPYNETTTYSKNNVVTFNGASFMAKQETTGNQPPDPSTSEENDYWGLLSRKGADGNGTVATHRQKFVANEGQTLFNLNYTYDQFQNRVEVTVGGVPQYGFEETTSTSVTLSEGVPSGVEVVISYFGESAPIQSDIQTTVDNHTTEISNHSVSISEHTDSINTINSDLAEKANQSKLNETNQSVSNLEANKMDKDTMDISALQINKNLGKFDQTYMTDEFLQQMTGNTPINAVPADKSLTTEKFADKSVAPRIASFMQPKGNLLKIYDIKTISGARIYGLSGSVATDLTEYSYMEDYTPVIGGLHYWFGGSGTTQSGGVRSFAWYDGNLNYISGSEDPVARPILAPEDARYFRGSFLTTEQESGAVPLYFIQSEVADNENGYKVKNDMGNDNENELFGFKENVLFPDNLNSNIVIYSFEPVRVDFTNKTIRFSDGSTTRVLLSDKTVNIPSDTLVHFDLQANFLAIVLNTDNGVPFVVDYQDVQSSINQNTVMIGFIDLNKKSIFMNCNNIIGDFLNPNDAFVMINGTEPVLVDFVENTVSFSYGTTPNSITHKIITRNSTFEIPKNTVLTIDTSDSAVRALVYDALDNSLSLPRWNESLRSHQLLLGVINTLNESVFMQGNYKIIKTPGKYTSNVENPLGYDLEDCSYSWWISPLAIRYQGIRDKTYIGYTNSLGDTGVASINNKMDDSVVKYHLKRFDSDDHNAASVNIREDGRILAVFSGGHNTDNYMRIRISKKPESVEEWEDEIAIDVGGSTTYAETFYKNGVWYIFYRHAQTGWKLLRSFDDGVTWDSPIPILDNDNDLYYLLVKETTDDNILRFVLYSNPNGSDTNIRMGFLHLDTGEIMDSDNTSILGTLTQTDYIQSTNFSIVVPVSSQERENRLLDVAVTEPNDIKIVYADFATIIEHQEYETRYVVYDNGNVYDLVDAGQPFGIYSNYVGGMIFDPRDSNVAYLSRQASTDDWRLEQWRFDGSIWTMNEEVTRGKLVIRPTFEIGGDKIFWQEGMYTSGVGVDGFQNDLYYKTIVL
ncbi:BNR-4 repeat-containing protein [Paraliobacillus ryukyuensis]|uniref:BNR-4 repeat-containing protein n=1 Tax=Paraliobacillus ryukyuensis TaxID=200904 RepID=UPI0009A5C5D3|nr:BNR-4 repeat-containing protein [Paraliobacillus ryukyuensis]